MQEIIYTKGYEGLKAELRAELSKSVESFVRIGYLLKVARDTNVLSESPYSNMEEFAFAEFKIDKGTASKFMNINDRFAEGGYSDRLKTEYSGIGWSKLSIMLQLPDSINEEITEGFSKSEIQAIKEEVEEAGRVTPMETLLEGETNTTAAVEDILDKAILQLGESNPEIYTSIHAAVGEGYSYNLGDIKSIMAPSGENMYSIRIRGVGRILLSVKDYEETIALVNERTGEKETRLWDDVARSWLQIIDIDSKPEENWETTYGQSFPKNEEVAPVQPKKESKVKKVNDTKPVKNDTKTEENAQKTQESVQKSSEIVIKEQTQLHDFDSSVPELQTVEESSEVEEEIIEAAVVETDEQLPGQMSVEDMPEIMPAPVVMDKNTYETRKRAYAAGIDNNIGSAMSNRESERWELVKTDLEDAIRFVNLMIELEGMEVEEE